ncbi:glycosyltransferase 87 family protein [Sphingomonas quercus]|uniref:DUF2029 domain-containing protein n=1 Tax=Sphingomonas quercus TaxID=2842451 RepID=A0ABS6BNM7_9SPHN|nr:glycosyltransferase 87 family protein [Sphingomonas quercus]MBU3079252.1 DUF2029 domain-containing protein [Sphingomonas quercus]
MRQRLPFQDIASAACLAVAIAYLIAKSTFYDGEGGDFLSYWTAGRIWADGGDPYSGRFMFLARRLFPGSSLAHAGPHGAAPWFYPPQWWLVATPVASLPADVALCVWRAGNALLLVLASVALARALPRAGVPLPGWAMPVFLVVAAFMTPTPMALAAGQSSILIFAGYCLYARGLMLSERITLAFGLFLLLLKPPFGVPAAAALLLLPHGRSALAIAGTATLVGCLPQFAANGVMPTIHGMLANTASYGTYPPNDPFILSGLNQIVVHAFGGGVPASAALLPCVVTSMAAALLLHARNDAGAEGGALTLVLIALTVFFMPLHVYDFVAIAPIAILATAFDWPVRVAAWLGVAICLRPYLLAGLLPAALGNGIAIILTIASLLALTAAALALRDTLPQKG